MISPADRISVQRKHEKIARRFNRSRALIEVASTRLAARLKRGAIDLISKRILSGVLTDVLSSAQRCRLK
jgi:hypothetical protein